MKAYKIEKQPGECRVCHKHEDLREGYCFECAPQEVRDRISAAILEAGAVELPDGTVLVDPEKVSEMRAAGYTTELPEPN